MDSIRQRFLQAEQDFLLAAHSDTQVLVEFADRWDALQADWEACLGEVDTCTQQLANEVVARIGELAVDFHDSESRNRSLENELIDSLEDVFASLSLEDCTAAGEGPIPDKSSETAESFSPASSVASPAQWLLHNLHNPYPLPHIRFSTGQSASSKHTKDWFVKARQRIGWTRLLRDRFAGCRSLATDAAFRAFVRDDPKNPLDNDLKTAFSAIKSHAGFVYGDEDTILLPSSKRLRSISPTPSLTSSSGFEDSDDDRCSTPSPINVSRRPLKRASPDSPDIRSRKRRRSQEFSLPPQLQSGAGTFPVHVGSPSLPSKKRCLSESDSDFPRPKRPRGVEGGRLHAVSDTLTLPTVPTCFDFDKSFQIPDPASTGSLDSSAFDVDFFDPLSLPPHVIPSTPALSTDIAAPADDFSTLFEIPRLDLLQPGLPTFDSDWAEFLNFEPNFSLFPYSPSLSSSLASTPPLIDDAILSPFPFGSDPSGPNHLLDILPHLNEKDIRFPAAREPTIQRQCFPLLPGEEAVIPSTAARSYHIDPLRWVN